MKSPHTGITRILKAIVFSYDGFKAAYASEAAFRQDLIVVCIGFIALFFLPVSLVAKALMASSLLLILLMELVNTAIETVIDRISEEYHLLSKKAKDIGSLLVLLSFLNAAMIWAAVIIQELL